MVSGPIPMLCVGGDTGGMGMSPLEMLGMVFGVLGMGVSLPVTGVILLPRSPVW